ncbi:30236_t:CDS:2, partial [Racocetra persica]
TRRRIGRIKQPKRVGRPRIRRNNPVIIPPRPKGSCYAKTPVLALPDSVIDKLITWRAGKYRDILNKNRKVTNQYKGGLYVERIERNGQKVYEKSENFWGWDDFQSTCSSIYKEETFESTLQTNEKENREEIIEDYIETNEYKIF